MYATALYYTDNQLPPDLEKMVQAQLQQACRQENIPIVCVSLKPMDFGDFQILVAEPRGVLTMFRQILTGLQAIRGGYVFFCEHDVLYPPSHFEFRPHRADVYYYNMNVWKLDTQTGRAVRVNDCKQTSGLCARHSLLLQHYEERVRRVEVEGFTREMGYEPGTHGREARVDDFKAEGWCSTVPIVDLRHGGNLTPSRWNPAQFRNKRFTEGWTESDYLHVPGWEGKLPCPKFPS